MILPLEKQAACFEFSRQLKEAGYLQDGLLWWVEGIRESFAEIRTMPREISLINSDIDVQFNKVYEKWVAPTVAELGEKLPMEPKPLTYFETTRLSLGSWIITYKKRGNKHPLAMQMAGTEADVRALMWLHLKKVYSGDI